MYFSLHYLSYNERLVIWPEHRCLDSVAIVEVGHDHMLLVGDRAVGTDIVVEVADENTVEIADERIVGAAGNLYMSHSSNLHTARSCVSASGALNNVLYASTQLHVQKQLLRSADIFLSSSSSLVPVCQCYMWGTAMSCGLDFFLPHKRHVNCLLRPLF